NRQAHKKAETDSEFDWKGSSRLERANLTLHWNLNELQYEPSSTCSADPPGRTWPCHALSGQTVATDRTALRAFTQWLGIRGRSHRPLRPLGRCMDGSRSHLAMPSM